MEWIRSNIVISIHTLRMEGDMVLSSFGFPEESISIHTLRMEGDVCCFQLSGFSVKFQSTPSAWRVTAVRRLFV